MSYPYIFNDNKTKFYPFDSSLRKLWSSCANFTQYAFASFKIAVRVQALIKTIDLRILSAMVWLSFVAASGAAASRMEVTVDDGANGWDKWKSDLPRTVQRAGLEGDTRNSALSAGVLCTGATSSSGVDSYGSSKSFGILSCWLRLCSSTSSKPSTISSAYRAFSVA